MYVKEIYMYYYEGMNQLESNHRDCSLAQRQMLGSTRYQRVR